LKDYGKSHFATPAIRSAWGALDGIGLIDSKVLPKERLE
jgi:hypothetical protein